MKFFMIFAACAFVYLLYIFLSNGPINMNSAPKRPGGPGGFLPATVSQHPHAAHA